MKYIIPTLLGIFLVIVAYSLFGSSAFLALACIYTLSLFLLFFIKSFPFSHSFLIGITLAEELFGGQHMGLATLLALIILLIHQLFAEQMRLTSLYIRFLAANICLLFSFTLLLFSVSGFFHRIGLLVLPFFILSFISYFLSALSSPPTQEIL